MGRARMTTLTTLILDVGKDLVNALGVTGLECDLHAERRVCGDDVDSVDIDASGGEGFTCMEQRARAVGQPSHGHLDLLRLIANLLQGGGRSDHIAGQ